MILVDTSVWIDHLRSSNAHLQKLLDAAQVLVHPYVTGEIAVGSFRRRAAIVAELQRLPEAVVAEDNEVLQFITRDSLHGTGIGYIDAHLLASVRLTPHTRLWTRDKRLLAIAQASGSAYMPRAN